MHQSRDITRARTGHRSLTALLPAAAMLVMAFASAAQDSRHVTEPTIPPVCTALPALLTAAPGIDPADEKKLDTERIQAAVDACPQGQAVELQQAGVRNAFLTGPLELRKGVTLLIDANVTLFASRDPQVYELRPGSCGVVNDEKSGCKPLIQVKRANKSGIMGEGTIDGRGGAKMLDYGTQQNKSWWDLAEDARGGGKQQVPRLIDTDYTNDFTLYKITLKNSPNFHVAFHHGSGLTVWGIRIDTPKTARNTDGIDPSKSKNITITQSWIRTGDDDVAIKAGDGPSKNITISHNHFYSGHGMSIGSETSGGVSNVLVTDLTLDGPDNGIRIKSNPSRGGLVKNVTYDDVCIRNTKYPLLLDTAYNIPGDTRKRQPVYQEITLRNVRISGGGKLQLLGLDETHRIGIQFNGVVIEDLNKKYKLTAKHADIMLGPGPVNFQFLGEDSKVSGSLTGGDTTLPSCELSWVPYPAH